MKTLRFALRGLWWDWRGGDLRLLGLALLLGVAAVTSVGFLTDRVDRALRHQGSELLAADLVLESGDPLPAELTGEARHRGLRQSRSMAFPSVILADGRPQLVQVKAVDGAYPLRGRLLVRDTRDGPVHPAGGVPDTGDAWMEPQLSVLLDLAPGDTVTLGSSRFTLRRLIALEPDRGGSLFQLGPRILINRADLPATGLVSAASRIKHRLMLAGPAREVAGFRTWVASRLPPNARVLGMEEARPQLRTALERGGRFLSLAALVTVIVTGAAVALATRRLVERQADAMAVMRCLGAGSRFLRKVLLLRLGALILVAGGLGALLGWLSQGLLAQLLGDWLIRELPAPGLEPVLAGLVGAALTLLGFSLPALVRLPRVPPLRVLRRELGPGTPGPWVAAAAVLAALTGLLWWQAGDTLLALTVLGGILVLAAALAGVAWLLIRLSALLQRRTRGIARFALASLSRHPGTTLLQVCGFGVGIMAMLLLAVVRVDLLSTWERSLPRDAPNRFLINILPDQVPALRRFLAGRGIHGSGLHPMVRGRLTHIGGRELDPDAYTDSRARRLATREFNLSWGEHPQEDNRIRAGRWWDGPGAEPQWSVESGIAETLGIRLGDRLTFRIAGRSVSAPVTSLRSVQWDSFNVNFFVVGSPALLRDEAATYISSFHLPPAREAVLAELVRTFPSVTVLDVSALMTRVRQVMERGSAAVEFVFLFTLGAGLLVLYAGIQAGAEGRRREAAILRTLGARRVQLLGAATVEFAVLGLLAGLLASLGAALTGWLLAWRVLELDYGFSPWLWGGGVGGAMAGIGLAGLLAALPLVVRPPLESLRRAES